MIKPIRLKTETEEQMIEALKSVLKTDEEGNLITSTHEYWLLMCGTLYGNTGAILTDEDGSEYPEKVALQGFHANLVTKNKSIKRALAYTAISVKNPLIKNSGEK